MQHIIPALTAAALAGIGFVITRLIRRDRLSETIARRLKLVTLHQRMKSANLTLFDVQNIERDLDTERD